MEKKVREISLKAFSYTFKEAEKCNRRFCFILGSGASREAGILTGIDMARVWARELREKYEESELKALMEKLGVKSIEPSSENYFGIYDLRYYPDYQEGYAFFERELEKGTPSLGHHALAKILAGRTHNLAITTNFDSLIEDALFIYTSKHPLVVGHESLTEFINLNIDRPIIAKIHRSLYFHPFNSQQETDGLAGGWQETLRNAFMVYTPVVIGYAGGDRSLMQFLRDESLKMNGLYWCYWNKEEPSGEIVSLVESKNGCFVPIDGFDQMMFMLSRQLGFENPEEEMKRVTQTRVDRYNAQYEKFEGRIREEAAKKDASDEVIINTLEELNKFNEQQLRETESKPESEQTFEDCFRMGRLHYRMGEYEEAISDYTRAIELKSDDADAYHNRGCAYYSMEEYGEAISDYTKAIKLKSDDAAFYNSRGCAYGSMEEYGKAISDYTRAIELKSDYADAYHNRGYAYDDMEEYEKAILDYTRAIELEPDDADAYHNRGCAYYNMEEYGKAIADYTKAIELKPDNSTFYSRGCAYGSMKEYGKAIADYTRAIELKPDNAAAYNSRGYIYANIEEYGKAIADYTRAIELKPDYVIAYNNREEVYRALGQFEKAEEDREAAEAAKKSSGD